MVAVLMKNKILRPFLVDGVDGQNEAIGPLLHGHGQLHSLAGTITERNEAVTVGRYRVEQNPIGQADVKMQCPRLLVDLVFHVDDLQILNPLGILGFVLGNGCHGPAGIGRVEQLLGVVLEGAPLNVQLGEIHQDAERVAGLDKLPLAHVKFLHHKRGRPARRCGNIRGCRRCLFDPGPVELHVARCCIQRRHTDLQLAQQVSAG